MIRDDRFETRLADWLEDGPFVAPERGVEAAVAHARAHPRGRLGWRLSWLRRRAAVPLPGSRLVWLAAALLALLLLGAAFATGSRFLAVVPATCPWWSSPGTPGPPDQERPASAQFVGPVVWDSTVRRMVMLARDAANDDGTSGGAWSFDVCSNRWHLELEADVPSRGPIVHDEDSGLIVAIGDTGVWTYDLGSDEWARRASVPPGWVSEAVYDPASGLIVGRSTEDGRVWTYEVETDTWREVGQSGAVPPPGGTSGFQLVGYDRSVGRLVLTTERGTWQLDPGTGTWEEAGPGGPVEFFIGGRQITYDETGRRMLVYGQGTVTAYDALTQSWEVLADVPVDWAGDGLADLGAGYAMTYDPLNDRLLVVGGTRWQDPAGWVPTDGVIAFDLVTREWLELLAPRD